MNLTTVEQRHRDKAKYTLQNGKRKASKKIFDIFNFQSSILIFASLCLCVFAVNLSCGSKPADLRALIPADSLVYLESNDLGAVMNAITERPAFREAAKTVPDFSVLNGVKLAVTVTGFETKELPVTDENSVLSFTPHFVAVLETNAWNFQAVSFTQDRLGEFINQVYGGEVLLETSDKHDGKYFVWTAKDGRKAFALVQGSVVFFGNDETSIEKCLAVKRNEADSIAKNPKITDGDRLAFGYVSPDGIAQIANIIGVKYGSEASDEPEVQSAVAKILPQLLRNTISEVAWTADKTEQGIEDNYKIGTTPEVAQVFRETFLPNDPADPALFGLLGDLPSTTRYNLKDPQIAWRSVLLTLQKQTDPIAGKIIGVLANTIFEPYGVQNPEMFLSGIESNFLTAKFDAEGEKPFVIATIRDNQKVMKSIVSGLKPFPRSAEHGIQFWQTDDNEIGAVFETNTIIIGSVVGVGSGFSGGSLPGTSPNSDSLKHLTGSTAPITTVGRDDDIAAILVGVLSEARYADAKEKTYFATETRFDQKGIERRTVSDFGFIGWIITQFGKEE